MSCGHPTGHRLQVLSRSADERCRQTASQHSLPLLRMLPESSSDVVERTDHPRATGSRAELFCRIYFLENHQ